MTQRPKGSKPAAASSASAPAAPKSSRVCIKNLPEKYTNDKLRKFCAEIGPVTDVKIMHKNGVSRKFAFVGFADAKTATKAVERLNRTFIQTSRISVEFARRIGEQPPQSDAARPWSKHSVGSSRHKALHPELYEDEKAKANKKKKNKKKNKKGDKKDKSSKNSGITDPSQISDKKLLEFLRVFVPKKQKSWANDDLVIAAAHENQGKEVASDDSDESDSDSDSDSDGDGDSSSSGSKTKNADTGGAKSRARDGEADLSETGRLFVRNLPYSITEEALENQFSKFGRIAHLHLPRDARQRVKGFCFIEYEIPEKAIQAQSAMDGQDFQGRILHIIPARARDTTQADGAELDGSRGGDSYKAKKQAELRRTAEDKDIWNTLFIRSDTAIGVIAEQMGLGKSEILDRESSASMVGLCILAVKGHIFLFVVDAVGHTNSRTCCVVMWSRCACVGRKSCFE